MSKVIIAGSRDIFDYRLLCKFIDQSGQRKLITEVVCGMGEGVDGLGLRWAKEHGVPWVEMPADWDNLKTPGAIIRRNKNGQLYNVKAGPDRNERMACYADGLLLLWDNDPRSGSADMLRRAKAHGLWWKDYVVIRQATHR